MEDVVVIWLFHPLLYWCITSYLCNSQISVKLDLRNNNLQELPRGAFTHTPYLTHLNLQRCSINKVKEGAFRALGRVVSLNLAYNKIDILYQVNTYSQKTQKTQGIIFPFQKHFLDLYSSIPHFFLHLPFVLQESFDGLSSLKELHLDHNRVEEVQPGAFTQLGFLNMLALTHNQLVYIPNMAFQVILENCFFRVLSMAFHRRNDYVLMYAISSRV